MRYQLKGSPCSDTGGRGPAQRFASSPALSRNACQKAHPLAPAHKAPQLVKIANEYMEQGIQFVDKSANDADNYPEDRPELMRLVAKVLQYPFPYLYDESQEVARAYDAACTPDIYVFDGESKLYYRGRLDSSRPNSGIPLSGEDLRNALQSLLKGEPTPEKQYPSAGCNIKWKK